MTPAELQKFMRLVNKTESCWLWTGSKVRGYGTFSVKRDGRWKNNRAHRLSFAHFNHDPGPLLVCHTCDNPSCVNPDHLFSGTQSDNLTDASIKGRVYRGGANTPWTRAKTHCKDGHPLFGDNLSSYKNRRVCLACMRTKYLKRKMKEKP